MDLRRLLGTRVPVTGLELINFSLTHQPKKADRLARLRTTDASASPEPSNASKDRAISRRETTEICNANKLVGKRRCRS